MTGLEGRTLGRYELRQLVGRGGMADVYRGYDPVFQREVAVKVFQREDEELLRRFVREARLMASLHNPHLMPIFDTGESVLDGVTHYYIVMPFMAGGSLRLLIRRGPLPLAETSRYLREIADVLDYIHAQGIIHRDIKASNVLLDADGNCYLADFGIARTETDATQLTSTGNVLGTVDYVAPELFIDNRRADAGSDLYSLGVLLFEMVTAQLPFSAENQIAVVTMHISKPPPLPHALVPGISPQVEHVMLRALAKQPEQRYGSATELADAFDQAITTNANPLWEYADAPTEMEQNEPLVLPPAPAVSPFGRQTNPLGAVYPSAPANLPVPPYQPQFMKPDTATSPERNRTPIVVILALVALLAVIGPVVYVLLTHSSPNIGPMGPQGQVTSTVTTGATATPTTNPTPTPNLTATAHAAVAATATQAAVATQQATNATATASAGATATVQAGPTATAGVIQTATAGTPLYQDALTNPNNSATQAAQWNQNGHCTFQSDGYHVTQNTGILSGGTLRGCLESGNSYSNMAISVNLTILSGHSGGVFFRISKTLGGAYSGYLFEIDSNGKYKVSRSNNFSTGSGNAILQDWTASSALKTGNSVQNTLQVIAQGSNLSFYANNTYLTTLQDGTFTSGDIGFLATTSSDGSNADMVYSNLGVYSVS